MAEEILFNGFQTSLAAGLNSGVLSMQVVDTNDGRTSLPTTGNFRGLVGREWVLCTARSGTTLTIVRGQEGSTDASHSIGTPVTFSMTATGLAKSIESYHHTNRRVFSVRDSDFSAIGDGVADDTVAIQAAFTAAQVYADSFQQAGGEAYITVRPCIQIPSGKYKITAPIIPGNAIYDIEGDGQAVLIASGTTKAFDLTGVAYRNIIKNLSFVGFTTAIKLSTTNLDTSRITIENCLFQDCAIGIDTVSYVASRSTNLTIKDCVSFNTKCFGKFYTDCLTITGCWFDGIANNDDLGFIVIDSLAHLHGNIFVPAGNSSSDPNRRWIDFYASDTTRRLNCVNNRFGGESGGGFTICYNYAAANVTYGSNNADQVCLSFDNCTLGTVGAPTGYKAIIRLFAMPNSISITNCGGSVVNTYMVVKDSSLSIPAMSASYLRGYTIWIDETSRQMRNQFSGYSLVDPVLSNYLVGTRSQLDRFRTSFPDAANYEGAIASSAGTSGKRMITIPNIYFQKTSRVTWGADTFGFFVHISGANADNASAESNALCYVSFAIDNTGTKRAIITKICEAIGGTSFANGIGTPTVFWGTDPNTGSADISYVASSGTELSIMWTGTGGTAWIMPMAGLETILSHHSAATP